jgi:uncharacterized protein (DUF983 family)
MHRRCPQCGRGAIYKGWTAMHDHCSVCGLKYLADQGDLWAYLIAIDRALFIFPFVILIYFRLNNPSSAWFYVFSILTAVLFVITLPHRNGMGLGVDYLIRRKWGDLAEEEAAK